MIKDILNEGKSLNPEVDKLEDQLGELYDEKEEIEKKIEDLEKKYKETVSKIIKKDIQEIDRKSSVVIVRPDGLGFVSPKKANSHTERNIYWYRDGKKAEKVEELQAYRGNLRSLKQILLFCYDKNGKYICD